MQGYDVGCRCPVAEVKLAVVVVVLVIVIVSRVYCQQQNPPFLMGFGLKFV